MLSKTILATLALALSVAAAPIPQDSVGSAVASLLSPVTGSGDSASSAGDGSGDGNGDAAGSQNFPTPNMYTLTTSSRKRKCSRKQRRQRQLGQRKHFDWCQF